MIYSLNINWINYILNFSTVPLEIKYIIIFTVAIILGRIIKLSSKIRLYPNLKVGTGTTVVTTGIKSVNLVKSNLTNYLLVESKKDLVVSNHKEINLRKEMKNNLFNLNNLKIKMNKYLTHIYKNFMNLKLQFIKYYSQNIIYSYFLTNRTHVKFSFFLPFILNNFSKDIPEDISPIIKMFIVILILAILALVSLISVIG